MAHRFNEALRKECPYCIIDEDRAAQNLVVPCFMSLAGIHSLAALIKEDRLCMGDMSLIVAGSGMELLLAQADRMLQLCNHAPRALCPETYREGLARFYADISRLV